MQHFALVTCIVLSDQQFLQKIHFTVNKEKCRITNFQRGHTQKILSPPLLHLALCFQHGRHAKSETAAEWWNATVSHTLTFDLSVL